jgi:hypothetical protein
MNKSQENEEERGIEEKIDRKIDYHPKLFS